MSDQLNSRHENYIQNLINGISDDDFEREKKWESQMQERGRQRYLRQVNAMRERDSEGNTSYGLSLIKHSIDAVQKAIDAYIEHSTNGGKGRHAIAATLLKGLDTNVVAFLTLRKLIDTISISKPLQNTAMYIANEIMFEAKLAKFKEGDRARWASTNHYLRHSQGRTYKHRVLNYALGKSEFVTWQPWPTSHRIHLGVRLIELVSESTGLVIIEQGSKMIGHKKDFYYVRATPKVMDWITHHNAHAEVLAPDYYPTIIPPKPWTTMYDGGYWFDHPDVTTCLIKSRDGEYLRSVNSLISNGHLEEVRQAVNAMQATAWCVDPEMLEIAQACWNAGGDRAGLPPQDFHHLPLCPICGQDITYTASALIKHPCFELEENKDTFKVWKKQAKEIRELNASEQGKRISVAKTLKIAKTMSTYDRFFFPYQLDFRGRAYTIPAYLTPQGTDLAKGLLKFAEKKPLGTMQAVKWLAVHVSNTYGNDKVSLDDRYDWTIRNQEKILACAEDPLENTWWMDADSPFCFLSACKEWAGYVAEGLAFRSSLPIAMDGTCNGLQIFSLILRDEIGGQAVNLVPDDKPNDIYGIVAQRVINRIIEDSENKKLDVDEVTDSGKFTFNRYKDAQALRQLPISRKTTKRQVMVMPYGGTMQSCIEYTKLWLEGQGIWHRHSKEFHQYAVVLARYIWDEIGNTVVKAREAMNYLQACARAVSKLNRPIYWETPLGLPIKQGYRKYDVEVVKTLIGDKVTKLSNTSKEIGYNKIKQANSISPNFVHSFDAAALQKTVYDCVTHGIHSYAMIHDSYGTHAADAPILAKTLRETFVQMFGHTDQLKRFEENILKQNSDGIEAGDLPTRPGFGSLDVEEVKNSLFFFA